MNEEESGPEGQEHVCVCERVPVGWVLTGVESRRGTRWAMSGVLVVTLQRSEQRWCGRWAHKVSGLADAERGQRGDSVGRRGG